MNAQQPHLKTPHEQAPMIPVFQSVGPVAIALDESVRRASVAILNQLLADTLALHDLYKKCHWQVGGPSFYQLHQLFDKHADEQDALSDAIAERVQTLGGTSIACAHDVAEATVIPRPPREREAPIGQLSRLLRAHEAVLAQARPMAREAAAGADDGTNDLLVSQVIRTNELQSWFISEQLRSDRF